MTEITTAARVRDAMSRSLFPVLAAAVTLAKNEQIKSKEALKARLLEKGYEPHKIELALNAWADYLARSTTPIEIRGS